MHDIIIIGSGAAGLSSAIYAGRYRMKVLVLSKEFGGETASAGVIENYPGIKSTDGYDLMRTMREQAEALGVEFLEGEATGVSHDGHCFSITTNNKEFKSHTLLFAMGTERRRLNLPNEKELTGKGVHYCVTCDGPVYGGKTIAIVGGGDASVKGANLAAEYAKKIYLIARAAEITAEPINLERLKKLGDQVELILENEVKEIVGVSSLQKIALAKPHKESTDLSVDGLFVEVGAVQNVALAQSLGVELDDRGYIKVDAMMKTNIDGVFAAGDVTNHFGSFKQDVTAAAQGAVAATSAYNDHKIHGEICAIHAQPPVNQVLSK